MKKNNKGFSLVELIIVIAIMAILAGALAPALIKYIAKSRQSTDVQNADTVRTCVQTSLSNPDAADSTSADTNGKYVKVSSLIEKDSKDKFKAEMYSQMGNNSTTIKYSPKGQTSIKKGSDMYVSIDVAGNTVTVAADSAGKYELSPDACEAWGGSKKATEGSGSTTSEE